MKYLNIGLYNIQKQIKFDEYDLEPIEKINNPLIEVIYPQHPQESVIITYLR